MRLIALAVTVPPMIAALLVAILIATAMPSRAAQPSPDYSQSLNSAEFLSLRSATGDCSARRFLLINVWCKPDGAPL